MNGTKNMDYAVLTVVRINGGTYSTKRSFYYDSFLPYGARALEGSDGRLRAELDDARHRNKTSSPKADGIQKAVGNNLKKSPDAKPKSTFEQVHGVFKSANRLKPRSLLTIDTAQLQRVAKVAARPHPTPTPVAAVRPRASANPLGRRANVPKKSTPFFAKLIAETVKST